MKLSDIDLINLTNIYIQQNNLAQGINETEFVDKYFEIYKKFLISLILNFLKSAKKTVKIFKKLFINLFRGTYCSSFSFSCSLKSKFIPFTIPPP